MDNWKQSKIIAYVQSINIHNKAFSKIGPHEIAQVSTKMALLPSADCKGFALIQILQSLSCLQSLTFPGGRQAAVLPQAGIQTRPQLLQDRRTLRQQIMKMCLCPQWHHTSLMWHKIRT